MTHGPGSSPWLGALVCLLGVLTVAVSPALGGCLVQASPGSPGCCGPRCPCPKPGPGEPDCDQRTTPAVAATTADPGPLHAPALGPAPLVAPAPSVEPAVAVAAVAGGRARRPRAPTPLRR
jgi:hypothetical protein